MPIFGGTYKCRSVRGRWSQALQYLHINFLEPVFPSLKHFLPLLSCHHVLVRPGTTTANRQGELCFCVLPTMAQISVHFLFLRSGQVLRTLNTGADVLSRSLPIQRKLIAAAAGHGTGMGSRTRIDLLSVSSEKAQCSSVVFFSLCTLDAPLGTNAMWAALHIFATGPDTLSPEWGTQPQIDSDNSTLASVALAGRDILYIEWCVHTPGSCWCAALLAFLEQL